METAPQITFRGLDSSQALTDLARDHLAKLERSYSRITSCRVTLEKRSEKGRKGHLYHVAVEMEVPGGMIVVNRKPGDQHAHEDVRVAMRDSFAAARRQLDDHVRKTGGVHIKAHPDKMHGHVIRLFADEGYGFLATPGGQEVYFQRDSLIQGDWTQLAKGTELDFTLMDGEKGPFAVNLSTRS